ncbi:recombinase family protein [Salmonella enterica]|nr:recombinase family protein [Salmonella enterica]
MNAAAKKLQVIAYRRVSTKRQGDSGLGLEAQQSYIDTAVKSNGWEVIATFEDAAVSGSVAPEERPAMRQAIELARKTGAAILVAKLDRLSRDVEDIARLMKRAEIRVATMPHATAFELHLFAALAEQERTFIKERTRAALVELQNRADAGDVEAVAKVANRNKNINVIRNITNQQKGAEARKAAADAHAKRVRGAILEAREEGRTTLQAIADYLNNETDVRTPRGAKWTAIAVSRVIERNEQMKAQREAAAE